MKIRLKSRRFKLIIETKMFAYQVALSNNILTKITCYYFEQRSFEISGPNLTPNTNLPSVRTFIPLTSPRPANLI